MKKSSNSFAGKKKNKKTKVKHDEYIQEAKNVANIVSNNIKKGTYLELSEQLNQLSNIEINREKYVFEQKNTLTSIGCMVACIVFSIIYLYFSVIFLGTIVYSDDFKIFACGGVIVSIILLVLNGMIIGKMVQKICFNRRYNTYIKDLRFKNIELIDDLAIFSNVGSGKIVKDLRQAVKVKLIPQGHFGTDNLIFMVSNDVYEQYKEKQTIYDQYYRKMVEERLRMKERTKEMQAILDQGQEYIDKIHEINNIIKDKNISQKLNRMENVVSMIFHEVDINPSCADELGMFMNYYLPTTEKLLKAYIEIDEKKIKGKTLEMTKHEIEGVMDKISEFFEGLLDKFYQEQELDIITDISTMELLMKQDGFSK